MFNVLLASLPMLSFQLCSGSSEEVRCYAFDVRTEMLIESRF